jgi:ribose transport system substrate-binding protein
MISRRTLLASAGALALGLSIPAQAGEKPTFALIQINQQALFLHPDERRGHPNERKAGVNLVIQRQQRSAAQNNAIETYISRK